VALVIGIAPLFSTTSVAAQAGVGASFETLQVGPSTYQHVKVKSVTARTIMIAHDGGFASVHLRDLSPELQAQFAYSAEAEIASEQAIKQASIQAEAKRASNAKAKVASKKPTNDSKIDRLLQAFGQAPEIKTEVDLRQRFFDFGLGVKDQGFRPSCSVFAVVSALELQIAEEAGQAEKLSEEYLIWATCKTLNRAPKSSDAFGSTDEENVDDLDEGFALSEVVNALRSYGIPAQSSLPNKFLHTMKIADPPSEVIDEARNHRRVFVHQIPGRDPETRLSNLIQVLDAGIPIPIGMQWPYFRAVHGGYIDNQQVIPNAGHAVTLVGYTNKTGRIEDTVFMLKNSWGARWGQGGYGHVTYRFLASHMMDAVLLEVQRAEAR
jgi:hypothetical protein